MSLTPQEERFCQEYVVARDGPAAYLRAFPKVKSERTAAAKASLLQAKPEVAARIAELEAPHQTGAPVTQEWVLERLKQEAEYTEKGCSHAARVAALGLLMKHLGLLTADDPPADAPQYDLSKLTDDQKRAILAGLRLARIGPASAGAPLVLGPGSGEGS